MLLFALPRTRFRRSEQRQGPGAAHLLIGTGPYLVGTILVTVVFDLPRNNALAAVDPVSADTTRIWNTCVIAWTAWNHVRTVAALVASALLTIGFCALPGA